MHIEKIVLTNFKSFKHLEIGCNRQFSVIVGENNIGKSTIFEALNLWKFIYDRLIQAKNKSRFYKASSNHYVTFSDLRQIRVMDVTDMFNDGGNSTASISVIVKDGEDSFDLKIRFERPTIKNAYLRYFNSDSYDEFVRFADKVRGKHCSLKNAIFIYQTRPVATIGKTEPFYNNGQIERKISVGKSHEVLRNKVLKTENSKALVAERFSKLESRLNAVLDSKYLIRFKNRNRIDEEFVRITAQNESHPELEISLMGSGFLQVLEIFSTIEYIERHKDGICLILIDEPDSHIHSDLQSRLIDELKKHDDTQTLLITHNDRLMAKVNGGELFYLNQKVKDEGKLVPLDVEDFPSVKADLASVLSQIELNEERPILITEGKTDKKIIETAWGKLNGGADAPFEIVSAGVELDEERRNGGARAVQSTLQYLSTLVNRKVIGLFDNDSEGNAQFKGLNCHAFEDYNVDCPVRRHKGKEIYGLLLPPPEGRIKFVTQGSKAQRYFVIEHYFSDNVLEQHNVKGEHVLDTEVFEICGNKNGFADACGQLNADEFQSFTVLFDKLTEVFQ